MSKNNLTIGRKFNTLTEKEYFFYIDNHKQYSDFNTLGLYRSLKENKHLSLEEKIRVRDYAHAKFKKSFDFLQVKDYHTWIYVEYLGVDLTENQENSIYIHVIRKNQQLILKNKKIKHRNFGIYSKHICWCYECCPQEGLMLKQGASGGLAGGDMVFRTDQHGSQKEKAEKRKKDRKNEKKLINREKDFD
jgi:hypothetical protein